ncbi:NUDIX domain-containing protein [Actinoplanes sp. L3-i22]|uniref:NUDIX domain-containing protein n=1 Tax=Actinoplanes sp. L3-i22 TaxID=2836373 RepID=UPI001C76A8AD|nr:NUDIX domain-containing protein [Actinoplanes sp. L3-i22]BCY09310.1 hypothetical protein L3i22_043980 [Actinoplanes sp. L3-i22]
MTGYASLAKRYGDALVRAGQVYPVVVDPLRAGLSGLIDLVDDAEAADAELLALGGPHLKWLLDNRPGLHDGRIVCWSRTERGRIVAHPGSYFDLLASCDAIRAEHHPGGDAGPLRDRAHTVAGDPLRSGRGRAAGIGVSVLLTVPAAGDPGQRRFVMGRRSPALGTDPGLWHVAPSGMLERDPHGLHLETSVARELVEELGVSISPGEVGRRAQVLGVVHDLLRLKPDVVVRLDLTAEEALGFNAGDGEFVEFQEFDITAEGISDFWATHPPDTLTAPAAGAVALLDSAEAQ